MPITFDRTGAGKVRRISGTWNEGGGGAASVSLGNLTGIILHLDTRPSAVVTPGAYSIQIRKESTSGIDLMNGTGATRSASADERCWPTLSGIPVVSAVREEDLYLTVTGADTGGSADFDLYILQEA